MAIVIEPYIPQSITVHLGPPDAPAENVTVSFPDYVKNVASSEIYPTWEPAAIRANVLAIISFALNRVYTEFYPSRGYDFQITSSTAYDQKFIRGRNFFDSISEVVDDIFDNYLRRKGALEPLAANVGSIKPLPRKMVFLLRYPRMSEGCGTIAKSFAGRDRPLSAQEKL